MQVLQNVPRSSVLRANNFPQEPTRCQIPQPGLAGAASKEREGEVRLLILHSDQEQIVSCSRKLP